MDVDYYSGLKYNFKLTVHVLDKATSYINQYSSEC